MRAALFALALGLTACATATGPVTNLTPADSPTQLIAGASASMSIASSGGGGGNDPLNTLTLQLGGERTLTFEEANHTPHDVTVQSAGGALAQVMGLPDGAVPTLYRAKNVSNAGGLCAPSGPRLLGVYTAPDGRVTMTGLKDEFQVETKADGTYEALPVGPAIVCARMNFRRG
jgi:hypothetical protein